MGETETPHFYDFVIFGRVPEPQNQLCLSLETPGYPKNREKNMEHLKHFIFINLIVLEFQHVDNFGKDGRRKIPPVRSTNLENIGYGINIYQKT